MSETKNEVNEETKRVFETKLDDVSFTVEGMKNGYRVSVEMDENKVHQQRRAFASFIQFAKLSEKAGWRLPWPIRILLAFWAKYKKVD
jgi:hypothetical protein